VLSILIVLMTFGITGLIARCIWMDMLTHGCQGLLSCYTLFSFSFINIHV
jgi:hypothetical protein